MFTALGLHHRLFRLWKRPTLTKAFTNHKIKCYRTTLHTSHIMRNYSTEDVTWLWEVNDLVRGYNEAAKQGTIIGAAEFTYNSIKPLEREHFEKTFDYFLRKFPNMKTVVRRKEGKSWFCQYQNSKVDFQVMSNEHTFRTECLKLLDKGFHDTDSMPWRARVVPRSADAPCKMEGVKKTHPYQYDFILMVNHSVYDGTDVFLMSSCLLYGLNCVISGTDFDGREYGTFENNREFEIMTNQRKIELLKDRPKFEAVRKTLPMLSDVPSTVKAFPRPNGSRPNSRYLFRNIDPQMMKGLLSKCKQTGVTFGSFAVSSCNLAMVDFMMEAGLVRDAYELNTLLFMNSRRYKSKKTHLQGCHLTALTYKSIISPNTKALFWDYCKKVNNNLQELYKSGMALDQTAMQTILDAEHMKFNFTDNIRPVYHDYTSNCMGDVTKVCSSDNHKYVKLTDLTYWQKIHKTRTAFMQEVYTLNGITKNNITYADNYFSDEAVAIIANKIFHIYELVGK